MSYLAEKRRETLKMAVFGPHIRPPLYPYQDLLRFCQNCLITFTSRVSMLQFKIDFSFDFWNWGFRCINQLKWRGDKLCRNPHRDLGHSITRHLFRLWVLKIEVTLNLVHWKRIHFLSKFELFLAKDTFWWFLNLDLPVTDVCRSLMSLIATHAGAHIYHTILHFDIWRKLNEK